MKPFEVGVIKGEDQEGQDQEGGTREGENGERRDGEYYDASRNCYVINDLV